MNTIHGVLQSGRVVTWNGPTGGSACLVDRGDSRFRCDDGRLLVGPRPPFWLGRLSVFLCEPRHFPDAEQRQGPTAVAAACTVSRQGTAPWDTLWLGAGPPLGYGHLWIGTGVTVSEPVAARHPS